MIYIPFLFHKVFEFYDFSISSGNILPCSNYLLIYVSSKRVKKIFYKVKKLDRIFQKYQKIHFLLKGYFLATILSYFRRNAKSE
jgi:hypothetical protein